MIVDTDYLYRDPAVVGILKYIACLILWVTTALILMSFMIWYWLPKWELVDRTSTIRSGRRSWKESLLLSLWLLIVGYSGVSWFLGVARSSLGLGVAICETFVVGAILTGMFILEGLEAAYVDLQYQDPHQLEENNDTRQALIDSDLYQRVRGMGNSFYEAREWAVVVLIVCATLMIEGRPYSLPLLDVRDSHVATVILTLVLTTFPLVWFAQSPGKAPARRNSAAFLHYWFSRWAAFALVPLSRAVKAVGLEHPSDLGSAAAYAVLKDCRVPRHLPPSEYTFFSDGLKKYGTGILVAYDVLTISSQGAVSFDSATLSYFIAPQDGIKRYFLYEKPFVADTVRSLETMEKCQYWAFETPVFGEQVTEEDVRLWSGLLWEKNPDNWDPPGYRKFHEEDFQVSAAVKCIASSDGQDQHRLDVSLRFGNSLPEGCSGEVGTRAMIVLFRIQGKTENGTVTLPTKWGEETKYPFFKHYSLPLLRSTTQIHIDARANLRFVYPSKFSVQYDGIPHASEERRFQLQKRPERQLAGPVWKEGLSELVYYVDSPLPGGDYENEMRFRMKELEFAAKKPDLMLPPPSSTLPPPSSVLPPPDPTLPPPTS
ncbi:MAG TPA: hypothetical protein VME68_10150 [Acidobacteriaceae bacterium]|nr:hypothetical protein [Acidobacteriaceae bacterium]